MVQENIYEYFEHNRQLRVLFIFDRMDVIGSELRACTWDNSLYVYKEFDGAWFNTKYAIENDWKDKRVILLFPEKTYPKKEEDMLRFPLLDILTANMEYKEEDYANFLQRYGLDEKYSSFVKRNMREISSANIMNMLSGHLTRESFSEDLVCRAFISHYLGEKKLYDWYDLIVRLIILDNATDEKKRASFFSRLWKNKDAEKTLNNKMNEMFNVSVNPNVDKKFKDIAGRIKYNSITQLLETNNNDDYKAYKITNPIQIDHINKTLDIGHHDKLLCEKFADAIDQLGSFIREDSIIECYGVDANYFYMSEAMCWPILKHLLENTLLAEPNRVNERMRELSLKFPHTSIVQEAIKFLEHASLYYASVRSISTLKLNTPELYVRRYIEEFYLIDQYYRHALEAYHEIIKKELPIEESIRISKTNLDEDYARFVNVLNLEWLSCVEEQGKHFDSLSLPKQEDFFNDQLDASTKKVVVVCDALRYELAAELIQSLSKEKHIAKLSAMRAMLPTETKFCKPALLPHRTLELHENEMLVDGANLSTTDQRTTHVSKYRNNALCVNYEDVMNGSTVLSVRETFKHPLVYIFYNTIDDTAHGQSPFEVIRACHTAIKDLSELITRLHSSWNVTNVVVTSDHGFIYNDKPFEEKDKHSVTEDCLEKKTRYYITSSNNKVDGIVKFPLDKVSGMTSSTPNYVALPVGTNRLAAPGGYNFAHGGATLQEMVVPVIHSYRKKIDKSTKVGVKLVTNPLIMVSSQLRFQLIQQEAVSMTTIERKISCCVYNGEEPVTMAKEITLNSVDDTNVNNRIYDLTLKLDSNKFVSSNILQLRVVDVDDPQNPLIKEPVRNTTIIEQDF